MLSRWLFLPSPEPRLLFITSRRRCICVWEETPDFPKDCLLLSVDESRIGGSSWGRVRDDDTE
jgi:hypothetical protein